MNSSFSVNVKSMIIHSNVRYIQFTMVQFSFLHYTKYNKLNLKKPNFN